MATQNERLDAMREFIEWARAEWGEPTEEEKARAREIWQGTATDGSSALAGREGLEQDGC